MRKILLLVLAALAPTLMCMGSAEAFGSAALTKCVALTPSIAVRGHVGSFVAGHEHNDHMVRFDHRASITSTYCRASRRKDVPVMTVDAEYAVSLTTNNCGHQEGVLISLPPGITATHTCANSNTVVFKTHSAQPCRYSRGHPNSYCGFDASGIVIKSGGDVKIRGLGVSVTGSISGIPNQLEVSRTTYESEPQYLCTIGSSCTWV